MKKYYVNNPEHPFHNREVSFLGSDAYGCTVQVIGSSFNAYVRWEHIAERVPAYKLVIHPNKFNKDIWGEIQEKLESVFQDAELIQHRKKNKGKIITMNGNTAVFINDWLLTLVDSGKLTSVKYKKLWR